MISKFICDRCGSTVELQPGEKHTVYSKLKEPRDVCFGCRNAIEILDKELDNKFANIINEIDKKMFPVANNIIKIVEDSSLAEDEGYLF